LLGLGIVYGLRIVHRWREDTTITAFAATRTTGKGLAFAALAIIAGLVSIVFARHTGVSAFGKILLIGIILCMFTALIILPAFIDYMYVMKNKEGAPEVKGTGMDAVVDPQKDSPVKKKAPSKANSRSKKTVAVKKTVKKSTRKKK
jgi:uncharacterized membrane protein YdfJ with MMPL/SSD domain